MSFCAASCPEVKVIRNILVLQPGMAQIRNRLNPNGRQHVLETSRTVKPTAGTEFRLCKSQNLPAIFGER